MYLERYCLGNFKLKHDDFAFHFQLTSNIFSFVLNLWNAHTENMLVLAASQNYDATAASVELSMLALKSKS